MKSVLENLSDKVLKFILNKMSDEIGVINLHNDFNDSTMNIVGDMIKVFDITIDSLDFNYIVSTYELNYSDIISGEDYELIRPSIKEFEYEIDVITTEVIRRTYQHSIYSYDENLVIPNAKLDEWNGNLDYWEGVEIDVDHLETENNDLRFDENSVSEI